MVSNATRWDTFEGMMRGTEMPKSERLFRKRYQKSPSFLSMHMGVRADLLSEVRTSPLHRGVVTAAPHPRVHPSIWRACRPLQSPGGCFPLNRKGMSKFTVSVCAARNELVTSKLCKVVRDSEASFQRMHTCRVDAHSM